MEATRLVIRDAIVYVPKVHSDDRGFSFTSIYQLRFEAAEVFA